MADEQDALLGLNVTQLKAKLAQLTHENAVLLQLVPGSTFPTTTSPGPTVKISGVQMQATTAEKGVLAAVIFLMLLLWALPFTKPIKPCVEKKIYRVFPAITVFNFLLLGASLNILNFVTLNDFFFACVKYFEVVLDGTMKAIVAFAALMVLILFWKFKDRILEILGVDNPQMVLGDFRDWATLWSMKRFYPIEVFIWKVEGLPSMSLHQMNDVFAEISCGYNNVMKTRVHQRAGHSCVFKESIQINYDHVDKDTRLYITIKNQDLMGSSEIATLQLGASQVHRLLEPDKMNPARRPLGWGTTKGSTENSAWAESRFTPIDLIPAGQVFLRFQPVVDEDEAIGPSYGRIGDAC